jgi:DNA modification methylase
MNRVIVGDCLDVMPTLAADSVDSIVTDPPYGLSFMGKDWDHGIPGEHFWREALRVAKPGAHLLAFGGTRTFHRLMVAIEDAGWEIRDTIMWVYGSGFPKSLDVSKAIDSRKDWAALPLLQAKVRKAREALGISQSEAARRMGLIPEGDTLGGGGFMWFDTGMRVPTREQYPRLKLALGLGDECDEAFEAAEREVVGQHRATAAGQNMRAGIGGGDKPLPPGEITAPASVAAKAWQGWGTALKPAWEPIIVARKPLAGTVAENVQRFGTGALNIDASRIGTADECARDRAMVRDTSAPFGKGYAMGGNGSDLGRWPANLIHDGSDEVVALFPAEAGAFAPVRGTEPSRPAKNTYGEYARGGGAFHADAGSAARFFYCAKADGADRSIGGKNNHPTVKPAELMAYLVRLVTPPGGTVLDPFAGSGSTGLAADRLQFHSILIELDPAYAAIAEQRIRGDAPLFAGVA